ncbi:MAG: hypothetical protein Ct9H300mP8_03980 [Gammaproteobacteria bacterium]|nr:MAG: hypothetical protein Ct9H300mP8_03980 [Gammaproteobacteria bacterium]
MSRRNALYAQSGGVTAVINASACGVIETARKHKDAIGHVFAANNGILGALTEELIDTAEKARAQSRGSGRPQVGLLVRAGTNLNRSKKTNVNITD